jgi:hypothetical protein
MNRTKHILSEINEESKTAVCILCGPTKIRIGISNGNKYPRCIMNEKLARIRGKEFYRATKHNKPCVDCKVIFPHYVLQWDHLRDKTIDVSRFKGSAANRKRMMEEIEKCELVCANCHAIRTYKSYHPEEFI